MLLMVVLPRSTSIRIPVSLKREEAVSANYSLQATARVEPVGGPG